MYKAGDMIVYGGTGVCKVVGVTVPDFAKSLGNREYYELEPLYERGTIYAPIDNKQIIMRYVMEREEADDIIDKIPDIETEEFKEKSTQKLTEHYKSKIKEQNCEDLIQVIMSAHEKKAKAEEANKKFGQIDKKYMKKAENLLYGELAIALDIEKDDVAGYIARKVNRKK
ncbi:MAG: CarD family transcriptional regulator [Eubacteriaceae bacterium]|nr:CarD family transcriptional regulator [Eubacteriaceae bacterium]